MHLLAVEPVESHRGHNRKTVVAQIFEFLARNRALAPTCRGTKDHLTTILQPTTIVVGVAQRVVADEHSWCEVGIIIRHVCTKIANIHIGTTPLVERKARYEAHCSNTYANIVLRCKCGLSFDDCNYRRTVGFGHRPLSRLRHHALHYKE